MSAQFICHQCKEDLGHGQVYVEWSTEDSVTDVAELREMEREGCVAEQFCSWICAARWFSERAGLALPKSS